MSGKSTDAAERRKALGLWEPPTNAGAPVACVATTFTFDAGFFETECLGRFLQMDTDPNENGVAYLVEREEKLAAARVSVLVDRRHATSKESLRWDVLPVVVRGAAQHAKLTLLVWADRVRVVIGSGNITEPGYRKNLEVFGTLDASRLEPGPIDEILECIGFLRKVATRALGSEERIGPKRRAIETLDLARRQIEKLPRVGRAAVRVAPVFSGTGRSVEEQLRGLWPDKAVARGAWVLSPFFDRADGGAGTSEALVNLLAKRGDRHVTVAVPYEKRADGKTRVMAPKALVESLKQRCEVEIRLVSPEQDNDLRPLHAKSLVLENDEWLLYMIGSSNFTRAGLGLATTTNLEANLAYLVRAGTPEADALDEVWPDMDGAVDLDDERIVWEPTFDEDGEGESCPSLPSAFREALFETRERESRLLMIVEGSLPQRWRVVAPDDEVLLSESTFSGEREIVVPWEPTRAVPFVLQVQWADSGGEWSAGWPVNVVDPATLPPPEALRYLTLDELVEILSTTRPLHTAVLEVVRRRTQKSIGAEDSHLRNLLDPHRRVSTETFLLRRTKRVGRALEHLRERLERPAASREAFEWRLGGPVGPLALAKAFRLEARTEAEAKFFLAEIALTLRRVRTAEAAKGGLLESTARELLDRYVNEIREIAKLLSGDARSAIARYAAAAFEEVKR